MSRLPYAIARSPRDIEGDSDVLVPWWSITKTVLAAAMLKLAEQNALDLDDCFDDRPFTFRQLLQHTAGLATYGGPAYHQAVSDCMPVWSVDTLLAQVNAKQLLFAPGDGWAYSNIGYLFVRQTIERATRLSLAEALDALVLAPLDIRSASLATTPDDYRATLWGEAATYDPRWVYHGLLVGPPTDAAAFLARLLAGELISKASLGAMQDARALGGTIEGRPWTKTGYGLGLMIGEMGNAGHVLGHSGVGPDTVSALYAFPDMPGQPVVATFAPGTNEGVTEHEAVRRAREA